MNRTLLSCFELQKQFIRFKSIVRQQPNKKHIYRKVGNAKKFGKILFYPSEKFEELKFPDPPKMFRIQRIVPLIHRIYWEKKILFDLGLINSTRDVNVVKNTPDMCALLWRVKHLISVEPITFPYGEPTEEDIKYTNLKHDGECIVHKKLEVAPEVIEATNKFIQDPVKLDKHTLKEDARLKWVRDY